LLNEPCASFSVLPRSAGLFIEEQETKVVLKNSAGRMVVVALAADPDVRIQEEFSGKLQNKVAIEIKGGTDKSNAHNRTGEPKNHTKKLRTKDSAIFGRSLRQKDSIQRS
jgi:hypothetical protein